MRLALFDLDNTLLGGDSDHAWGDYLCERGFLDAVSYKARNDEFYQDYLAGKLDNAAYLNFCWAAPRWKSWLNGTSITCATASNPSSCPKRSSY
jgi:phosphoserine phosphatase